jgi:hypothetical protein
VKKHYAEKEKLFTPFRGESGERDIVGEKRREKTSKTNFI